MKLIPLTLLLGLVASLVLLTAPPTRGADAVPLPHAHAHNDYLHPRPLLDALDQGFCSVEADVWLVDGELRVAHDLDRARPGETLQKLYLDPIMARVEKNGGRVFPSWPFFTLLIDVKSDATNTYAAVREALRRHQRWLTTFDGKRIVTNAVTVVVSGNRARGLMAAEKIRWAGYDGRLADLESPDVASLIPMISDNWQLHFRWKGGAGEGPLPESERTKLRQLVEQTHRRGQVLRLWGAPDNTAMWSELAKTGVDYINTDQLQGLAEFYRRRQPNPSGR